MRPKQLIYLIITITVVGSLLLRITGMIGEDSYWRGSGLIIVIGGAVILILMDLLEKSKK